MARILPRKQAAGNSFAGKVTMKFLCREAVQKGLGCKARNGRRAEAYLVVRWSESDERNEAGEPFSAASNAFQEILGAHLPAPRRNRPCARPGEPALQVF